MADLKFDERFQDPVTGEMVSRLNVKEELLPGIEKAAQTNAVSANNFLQLSRQIVTLEIKQREEYDKANAAEQEIGKEVIRLREKMGLDSSWIYNLQLRKMEKRDPPADTRLLPAGVIKP